VDVWNDEAAGSAPDQTANLSATSPNNRVCVMYINLMKVESIGTSSERTSSSPAAMRFPSGGLGTSAILKTPDLTSRQLTYAMLLSYAWQNDHCFPGQERLAKDMGAGKKCHCDTSDELQTELHQSEEA
jgi:hypothetical protein